MSYALPALALALIACTTGCRGDDINFDCEEQAMKFLDEADAEPSELIDIPSEGPYPVAITLTHQGLTELVNGIIDEGVPLQGEVPFGILPQGPSNAEFEAESTPEIKFRKLARCPNCVIFRVDFGVQISQEGQDLSSGAGWAELAIPLRLETDEASGTTTLLADYSKTYIDKWDVSVYGFDSQTHTVLAGALRLLLEEAIQEDFEPVNLIDIGSWTIGRNEVKLAARDVIVQHDLNRLVLAMHTNLPLPDGVGIDLAAPLPAESKMGVAMHPGLMLGMAHRMLEEGEIPRRYNEDGQADTDGIYGITLTSIRPGADPKAMTTEFRVWRTADGYCGFANVEMPLAMGVNMEMSGITVSAGEAMLLPGGQNEGFGVAAEEEERLVAENQDLVDTFRKELTEQLANTLNYEELGVEGSRVIFTTQDVSISETAINTYFDFLVLALPEGEGEGEGEDDGG